MDAKIPPDKAYFRIREVSRILGVEPYIIRFWESEFPSLRPNRTKSDQRIYRRDDIQELLAIKTLLYEELFTIKGAKRQLAIRKKNNKPSLAQTNLSLKLEIAKAGLAQIQGLLRRGIKK